MPEVRGHDRDTEAQSFTQEIPPPAYKYKMPKLSALPSHDNGKTMRIVLLTALVATFTALLVWIGLLISATGNCPAPPTSLAPTPDPCDDGWIWYRKKCYYFSSDISEWEKSQDFCSSRNASLAIITSRNELTFILRFKGSPDHWIGLKRESDGGPWVWTNGTVFDDMFTIVGVSDCVLVNSGRISSASCYSDKHWICNKPDAFSLQPHF
ncbi:C-type lectin domain family 2 member D-like isoform 1-T1 [Leptodactylus fuscus]|uniref:C-type lectin domain family 2 member D-like n=1 Tax=Leptodactylus fuscus TaxID=238119 RepID=UPI003F4ECE7A